MTINEFVEKMPKIELHVHIEGAVLPGTLLQLAERNRIALPAQNENDIRTWYQFKDFAHFITIYEKISKCIQTIDDIEFVVREFLKEQARQNIRYTEATWTPFTHYQQKGLAFAEQLAAINRAADWAKQELQVDMGLVIDIPRHDVDKTQSMMIANWAVSGKRERVVALGIGGKEVGFPPDLFSDAFAYARQHGLAMIPHAGETVGAESIWSAIRDLHATRIYHGVRAVEDDDLIAYLRETQIPLDICPTSNVCLGVVPDITSHMLPQLLDAGVFITINSDDPPMFNTTLTNEYIAIAETFNLDRTAIQLLIMNALEASLLSTTKKNSLRREFQSAFEQLSVNV